MIEWKLRAWRSAGVAALLAACGAPPASEPPAGDGAAVPAEGESAGPTAAAAGEGGEAGEAGAATAYAGLTGDARTALRLAHLKGFLTIAAQQAEGDTVPEAAVLIQQGLLEVYDPASDQFGGLDIAAVRAAADYAGVSRAEFGQKVAAAMQATDAARASLTYNHADTAARMVDIATGIYSGVIGEGFVDPIEYQHSLGAAMSARDVLAAGESELKAKNARAYNEAMTELNKFVALWPQHTAPDNPTPYRDLLAQGSRVRLALSPFLDT